MADDKPEISDSEAIKIQAEWDASFSGPAIAVNRFYLVSNGAFIRIGFCEQRAADRPPLFRTAIVLTPSDALSLAQLITGFAKQMVGAGEAEK